VGAEGWASAVAARSILERVAGLEGAAEIVGALYENWDGTGMPGHLLQGQIPLRSRILRAVTDYFAALDRSDPESPNAAVASIMEHKAVRYDPLVLVHLEAIVSGQGTAIGKDDRRVIPITALEPGMVLADDLYTSSGIKLLARGTRLGTAALEAIRRRHRSEPIHHGATILRRSA
jgi:hypothetical protein